MRSVLKKCALGVAGASLLALLLWYALSFRAHLDELRSIADKGQEVKVHVNPAFRRLAELGETEDRIRSYAIRQAYWSIVAGKQHQGMISWHLNNILWLTSSHLHFNEDEAFGIWVECSIYGCGHGLMDASEQYFRKPINALSVEELAGLVALVKSPQMFAPGTAKGEERKLKILEQYYAGS